MFLGSVTGCGDIDGPPLARGSDLGACTEVAAPAPAHAFSTQSYFTTWGSAIREGATLGVREGLADGGGIGTVLLARLPPPDTVAGAPVIWRSASPPTFCMRLPVAQAAADRALGRAMARLGDHGYRVRREAGLRTTNFARREHRAAKWIDRFRAEAVGDVDGSAVVYVTRDVAISRRNSPYVEATSVGRLETTVLTWTRDAALGR